LAEWYWQAKAEVVGEKPVPVSLSPPQISHGLVWDKTRTSVVTGQRLTAWTIARFKNETNLFYLQTQPVPRSKQYLVY
jgi:hypothetical protein